MSILELFESTQSVFQQWRNDGHRRRYPKALKQDAVALLSHYRIKVLSETLGVTAKSLRHWSVQYPQHQHRKTHATQSTTRHLSEKIIPTPSTMPPLASPNDQANTFIPLMLDNTLYPHTVPPLIHQTTSNIKTADQLTLTLPHGLTLTLPQKPVTQTAQLIGALIKELATCSI